MKKYIITSLLVLASFSYSSAIETTAVTTTSATVGDIDTSMSEMPCIDLKYNLKLRSRDATTNNEVMMLQDFLVEIGLLDAEPNGYFGNATLRAVKTFQKQNGFVTSGYVGPLTRKAINLRSCGQKSTTKATPSTQTPSDVMCTMEYRACADGSAMPREATCKWREDKCPSKINTTPVEVPVSTANTIDFSLSSVETCIDPPTEGYDIYVTMTSPMPSDSMIYMGEDTAYSTGRFSKNVSGLSSTKIPVGLSAVSGGQMLGLEPERAYYVSLYNGATKTTSTSKTITLPMCQKSEVLGAYLDASNGDTPSSCVEIGTNLHRGKETSTVKKLQSFLYQKGFLLESPTGFYGDATIEAVKMYQGSRGITESGMVYEATRQMIKTESCGN